mmetsp:Transcript_41493/g.101803  ORF Transcript_41493/g.101803 Transcript_41493/m.101803 type:complete len:185 (+) Transcript_41493:160-714(+)|eukprot:CAMPEP_0206228212 /NCGR_PEP_ID=MMETSP0047_2-20121206/9050_1 /ASSEMBLY_ACC=CAM_ASM_000192 /TAXON_ID=195065 /ORGANISM="Chroomonas mesostigmatica_cf, Strain CCMP1168" /LENGTH=184 /DNA_ID=CAMNT_0053651443 /DNA_START=156 /DNA_END=710 /DNA_ORIENTATION=+
MPKVKKEGHASKAAIRDHKIKQIGALHPNSRKAAQKHGELLHSDKKAMHIATRDLKWKPQLKKMAWFQKVVWMDEKPVYSKEEMTALCAEYVTRNDEEIAEAIRGALVGGGSGRLAPTSNVAQKHKVREHEREQYTRGELAAPDMTHPKVVRAVRDWRTGNVDQMQVIKSANFGDEKGLPDIEP